MAISIVGSNSTVSSSITLPAGVLDGDIMVVFAGHSGAATVPTLNAAWTALDASDGVSGPGARSCYRVAASEPASYTFTNMNVGTILVLRGQDTTTPINAHSLLRTASGTTLNSTAVTTTVNGCQIVWSAILGGGTVTAVPSGYTDEVGVGSAKDVADISQTSAGSSGAVTGTQSASNSAQVALVAVAPAGGGGGGSAVPPHHLSVGIGVRI